MHFLQDLAADLAQITFDYPFRIPPYFALIIRAIGVLEGIALVGNPEARHDLRSVHVWLAHKSPLSQNTRECVRGQCCHRLRTRDG